MWEIKINEITIKKPTTFKISHYNLTTPGRLSEGLMVMDFIAKKKKLFFTYDVITNRDLKTILDIIDTNTMFFTVKYYDYNGTLQTKTMYVGEIPMLLHIRANISDYHIWKDVDFNLIER